MQNLLKYCLYARKSSESDERQAMSIDSQIKEMQALAKSEGLFVTTIKRESHSAKLSSSRNMFNQMLYEIRNNTYDAILTWAPDRLSRNAGDLGALIDLMDAGKLKEIRTHSQIFSNNPNEKFLLMILCSQAKLENDNRAINVKRGIRAKCEMGWRPCMPPLGYYTRAASGGVRDVIVDEARAPFIVKIFEMSEAGKSGRYIKQWLIDNNIKTRKGNTISLSMIYKILKSSFYYGRFEYPRNSGNWYSGKHIPLISKKLFDDVQKALIVPQKSKWGSKDFPFKGFLKCYTCGSTIVGEEKFKKLRDGSTNRHVYYHCSRQVNYNCPEKYVRESCIIRELSSICDQLLDNNNCIEPGLKREIDKYVLIIRSSGNDSQDYLKGYVKYVLTNGSDFEKSRLVRNLSIKLALHNKTLIQI